ncbi:hypothetical protein LCGC14_0580760 [marine sediment metagenome]|uniref:DUF7007 domain-containing protein n=1 Tax=marine sediment metagenome TaxID=412755 RepID=A0A0F9RLH7_9ZZZZ
MLKPTTSPWGAVQSTDVLADGIVSVSTASHGGIKLDADRQAAMPEGWSKDGGWYEEDCNWCLPFIIFQADILAHGDECAVRSIKNSRHVEILQDWHPDLYEEYFNTKLKEGESYIRTHPLNKT